MNLGERLLTGLLAMQSSKGWSETAVASEVGVTAQVWSNWKKRGAVAKDGYERVLERFPELFSGRAAAVVSFDQIRSNAADAPKLRGARAIPVVGRARGGDNGYFEEEGYPVGYGSSYVSHGTRDANAFALRIEGDSMRPRIRHGEFVVIEPNATYSPGDDVYVALKDGRKLVKTLGWQRDGMTMLLSVNDSEAPISVSNEHIECVYRVGGILPTGSAFEP